MYYIRTIAAPYHGTIFIKALAEMPWLFLLLNTTFFI